MAQGKIQSAYPQIDTPALLVDRKRLLQNIRDMQDKCNSLGVALRPHTKTHKCPEIAAMQLEAGAAGIAVAKIGEAEVMADAGITDIMIANEPVGAQKLQRLAALAKKINLSFGVESVPAVLAAEAAFAAAQATANVVIEIETGENRSGVVTRRQMEELIHALKACRHVRVKGVFSHEGHTYKAASAAQCLEQFVASQQRTLELAGMLGDAGIPCQTVSIGATPSAWLCSEILPGITELRPGTYVLMDAAQGNAIGGHDRCAATILTTVMSKPTDERIICDVGAKGITAQVRAEGICKTQGLGLVKNALDIHASAVYDEHMIFYSRPLWEQVEIGDKIEIIPNHICPVSNLYDTMLLVEDGRLVGSLEVACRGKLT